jgi:hypothetical protein
VTGPEDVGPDADIDALVRRFDDAAIPHAEWTHACHLIVGTWYVARWGAGEALPRLRAGIRRLNESHGTPNSPTRGYHETITRAYVYLIGAFLERGTGTGIGTGPGPDGTSLTAHVRALLGGPLGRRDALLAFYTRETLFSPRARAEWVEPDRRPLGLDVDPAGPA